MDTTAVISKKCVVAFLEKHWLFSWNIRLELVIEIRKVSMWSGRIKFRRQKFAQKIKKKKKKNLDDNYPLKSKERNRERRKEPWIYVLTKIQNKKLISFTSLTKVKSLIIKLSLLILLFSLYIESFFNSSKSIKSLCGL